MRGLEEGKTAGCSFASETGQLRIVRHARVSLLLLWERAGEDAFKYGIFNFVRHTGLGEDRIFQTRLVHHYRHQSIFHRMVSGAPDSGGRNEDYQWSSPSASPSFPFKLESSSPATRSTYYSPTSSRFKNARIQALAQNTNSSS